MGKYSKELESQKLGKSEIEKFDIQGLASISKDVKNSVVEIKSRDELRFLTDSYYQAQNRRIAADGQIRSIIQGYDTGEDPNDTSMIPSALLWVSENAANEEKQIYKLLDAYTDTTPVGRWCKAVTGLGPVITAVMLATFNIEQCTHVNQFNSYAGLNDNNCPWLGTTKASDIIKEAIVECGYDLSDIKPSDKISNKVLKVISEKTGRDPVKLLKMKDEKKDCVTRKSLESGLAKIPYNKDLKKNLWLLGESFVKVSNKESSLYGKIYKEKKELENYLNDNGEFAEQARIKLATTNIGKSTDAYKYYSEGKLPPAHIQARAKRYAVKLFISHLFDAMYMDYYKKLPPLPYPIAHQGHVDIVDPEVPYKYYIEIPKE